MGAKKREQSESRSSCRWKGCNGQPIPGSAFCQTHVQPPATPAMPAWIRELSWAVGTGLASSILYDMLKIFAENVHFHDTTAAKVAGMMARLQNEDLSDLAINEVAEFLSIHATDPGFASDMETAMRRSGRNL